MNTGSVQGQVVRADASTPVAQAAIAVIGGPGPYPDMASMTDQDGRFALDDMAAGEWRLSALGANGESGQVSVQVAGGNVAQLVILVR